VAFRPLTLSQLKPRLLGYACDYHNFVDPVTGGRVCYYQRISPFSKRLVHWPVPPYPDTEPLQFHEIRIMCKTLHIPPADFGVDVP